MTFQWHVECGMWVLGYSDILACTAYAQFNQNMRDKFDIEGRDVKLTTAKHCYSVSEEINLPHVQECLETLMN